MSTSRGCSRVDAAGFTLVELMVAMILFALVIVATTPLLIGGLNAGRAAKLNLQAKALGQERLEALRNLPFHVDRANGVFIDLLDTYFRDLQPIGTITPADPNATPPTPADLCAVRLYDPVSYAYTCKISAATLGAPYTGFTQEITSQFINAARVPVVPPAGYDSQVSGRDAPVSNLLSVSILTKWTDAGKSKSFLVRSQISNSKAPPSTLQTELRASALTLNTNTAGGDVLHFEGGTLSEAGSLGDGSTVSASALAASAQLSSGTALNGASFGDSRPNGTPVSVAGAAQQLSADCSLSCFGTSGISGDTTVSIVNGLHAVSSSGNPLVSQLNRDGSVVGSFVFGNGTAAQMDPTLGIVGSPISGATTGNLALKTSGYVDTARASGTPLIVTSTASVPYLQLFPITGYPGGILQLKNLTATLSCATGPGGVGSAVSATWAGTISYLNVNGTYTDLPALGPGSAVLPRPSTITIQGGLPLSHWISDWSALTSASSAVVQADTTTKGAVPGIVNILTVPTRAGDLSSPINVAVAPMTCLAVDNR